MGKSKEIDAIAAALAKAQGQCKAVKKSGKNPHLNSVYVTLDDIINSIRQPLAENGLAYTQLLHGKNGSVKLTTLLMHESGQWIDSTVVVEAGAGNRGVNTTQALGSSITYMKRYTLSAMLGIAAEVDDDGNGTGKPKQAAGPNWDAKPKTNGNRPLAADTIRTTIRTKAGWEDDHRLTIGDPITEGQIGAVGGLLTDAVKTKGMKQKDIDKARYDVLDYLVSVRSTGDLYKAEASAIIAWLKVQADGEWDINEYARAETAAILNATAVEAGQQEMEL